MKTALGTFLLASIFCGLFVLNPSAKVEPADASIRICWIYRDYIYNAKTGEFIQWVGEPYESDECWTIGDSDPRPPHTTYDDPMEGIGTELSEAQAKRLHQLRCEACKSQNSKCMRNVQAGAQYCEQNAETMAKYYCYQYGAYGGTTVRGWTFYDLMMGKHSYPGIDRHGWEFGVGYDTVVVDGRKRRVKVGRGPAWRNCMDTYKNDHPSWSWSDNRTATVTATFKPPGGEFGGSLTESHDENATWGGQQGYHSACAMAALGAGNYCSVQTGKCLAKYDCDSQTEDQPIIVAPVTTVGGGKVEQ